MLVLIPVAWPFLVVYLMFRFWRVTLTLAAIGITAYVLNTAPAVGVIMGVVLIAGFVMIANGRERAAVIRVARAREIAQNQRAMQARYEYERMELQAEMNARALIRAAKEL